MATKRARAKEVAKPRADGGLWIDHALIEDSDLAWMHDAQRLILWNVTVPRGFLACLPNLWWLDIRGGSAEDLEICRGAAALEYLEANQVRGMHDLSVIAELRSLRFLRLYGLSKVAELPSCSQLSRLELAQFGQMRGLGSIAGVLDAPNLREVSFSKTVPVSLQEADRIREHSSIERFGLNPGDVPASTWERFVERVGLPNEYFNGWPEHWFFARGRGSGVPVV